MRLFMAGPIMRFKKQLEKKLRIGILVPTVLLLFAEVRLGAQKLDQGLPFPFSVVASNERVSWRFKLQTRATTRRRARSEVLVAALPDLLKKDMFSTYYPVSGTAAQVIDPFSERSTRKGLKYLKRLVSDALRKLESSRRPLGGNGEEFLELSAEIKDLEKKLAEEELKKLVVEEKEAARDPIGMSKIGQALFRRILLFKGPMQADAHISGLQSQRSSVERFNELFRLAQRCFQLYSTYGLNIDHDFVAKLINKLDVPFKREILVRTIMPTGPLSRFGITVFVKRGIGFVHLYDPRAGINKVKITLFEFLIAPADEGSGVKRVAAKHLAVSADTLALMLVNAASMP